MVPAIFDKFFAKRERGRRQQQKDNPYPWKWAPFPCAIGVSDSTCEVNGDPFNAWRLPIPENRGPLRCTRPQNCQKDSEFFNNLPKEVRRMIYIELIGNRRVHIEYGWMPASPYVPKPFQSKPLQPTFLQRKRFLSMINGQPRYWNWHHSICQESISFAEDAWMDRCVLEAEERWKRHNQDRPISPPPGTKLEGVEWLRCCQLR